MQLPIFQDGIHLITKDLGYQRKEDQITYFLGMMPIFNHGIEDIASFQMISSQFYVNGNVKQMDIVRAFGIKGLALKRWVKKYRQEGPKGFYTLALCRIKAIENLRYTAPGEWGKLLGLDRDPEVKTLREKLKIFTNGKPEEWAAQLSKDWMQEDTANVGVLYIDGHTRVYHGHQTKFPRHYVARQRLCLRATTQCH